MLERAGAHIRARTMGEVYLPIWLPTRQTTRAAALVSFWKCAAAARCTLARCLPLFFPLALVGAWHFASLEALAPPQVLPSPAVVFDTFVSMCRTHELSSNLLVSGGRVLLGFALGGGLGLALGWATGLFPRVERLLYPTIVAIAQVPALGFIPLFMMFLGIGESLKLVIVAKAVLIPVLIHTMRGVQSVSRGYWELAKVNEHSWFSTLLRLVVPASLRQVVTGLRLGLSQAWLALVTVELLASSEGIGYVLVRGRQLNQIDVVLVTAVVIGVVGYISDALLKGIERLADKRQLHGSTTSYRQSPRRRSMLESLLVPTLLVIGWALASARGRIDSRFVPSPWQVARTLGEVFGGELYVDITSSLARLVAGVFWGSLLGVVAGVILGQSRWLAAMALPTFNAFRQVTLIAWIPILTLWVGQDESAKETFIALAVFMPMLLCAYQGSLSVTRAHSELAATVEASAAARVRWVVLPSALPNLLTGLELATVYGWLATIGAEYFFKVAPGVGNAMIDGREQFRMDLVVCSILIIGLIGFALNRVILVVQTRTLRWSQQ